MQRSMFRTLCHHRKLNFFKPSQQNRKIATLFYKTSFYQQTVSQGRQFSVSSYKYKQIVSPDNIISSPIPDVQIPNVAFHEYMFGCCDRFENKIALEEFITKKTCTYGELKQRAVQVANNLHKLGFRKGDVVLCFSPNCIEFTVLMLACSCIGVWFSPANPTFTAGELSNQLQHGGAKAVFVHPVLAETMTTSLKDFPQIENKFTFGEVEGYVQFNTLTEGNFSTTPEVSLNPQEDILALPYSSGTTGLPKGVMLTHRNCVANVIQTTASVPVKESDVAIGLLPLYHIYGMIVVQFGVLEAGGKVVLLPKFEPENFLNCIQDNKVTVAHLVPPLILFMAKHPMVDNYDVSSVRLTVCGAAPLGGNTQEEFRKRHKNVEFMCQGYGLTETSPVTNIDISQTLGCAGNFVANTFGKIVDMETNKVLGAHEEGELYIKGPQVMKGYYNNQKATDDMIDSQGWLATGDIAIFDEEGKIFIKDRLKELIKYKGSQVAPAELEAVVLCHPAVLDVGVIGITDEVAGEVPKAFVVKKPGAEVSEDEIIQHVRERVAKAKQMRGGVQFVTEIPKNPSGKILRRVLRAQYNA